MKIIQIHPELKPLYYVGGGGQSVTYIYFQYYMWLSYMYLVNLIVILEVKAIAARALELRFTWFEIYYLKASGHRQTQSHYWYVLDLST